MGLAPIWGRLLYIHKKYLFHLFIKYIAMQTMYSCFLHVALDVMYIYIILYVQFLVRFETLGFKRALKTKVWPNESFFSLYYSIWVTPGLLGSFFTSEIAMIHYIHLY